MPGEATEATEVLQGIGTAAGVGVSNETRGVDGKTLECAEEQFGSWDESRRWTVFRLRGPHRPLSSPVASFSGGMDGPEPSVRVPTAGHDDRRDMRPNLDGLCAERCRPLW